MTAPTENAGLFATQGAPYAPFLHPGDVYQGVVTNIGQVQGKKFKPKGYTGPDELEVWPDGKPKMVAIVTVQTNLRDPEIPEDDGQRSIWIKGKSMNDTVRAAIKAAGASKVGIQIGGWFSMAFTHETPNDPGMNPTKHYMVEYRPPTPEALAANADPWSTQALVQDVQAARQAPQAVQPSNMINNAPQATTPAPTPQAVQQPVAASQGTSEPEMFPGFSQLPPDAQAKIKAMAAAQQGGQS
jgi:hypothetical protein